MLTLKYSAYLLQNEFLVFILAVIVLFLDLLKIKPKTLGKVTFVGLIAIIVSGFNLIGITEKALFGGMLVVDPISIFFKNIFLLIALVIVIYSLEFMEKAQNKGEYYVILLFILLGMCLLASSAEFITLFISLELVSIPLYVLAAFEKNSKKSSEAGIKYFLLGAFASSVFLFGVSYIYGILGTTYFSEIIPSLGKALINPALIFGFLLVISALSFKIAAAPFHMWAPDVYEGSPTPVTAFISVAPKAAGIIVLVRLLQSVFMNLSPVWSFVIASLALFSMIIGNLAALFQDDIKRLLAYSGIAHIGYILVGLSAASVLGLTSVIFYTVIYVLTNLAAFGVVIVYSMKTGSTKIQDFAGLDEKSPALAFILFLALLSMAGIPPLSGFIGKFYLFAAAFQAKLYFLVFVGILMSVVSLFYYLRVLKYVYFIKAPDKSPVYVSSLSKLALSATALAVIFLGLYPFFNNVVWFISRTFLGV